MKFPEERDKKKLSKPYSTVAVTLSQGQSSGLKGSRNRKEINWKRNTVSSPDHNECKRARRRRKQTHENTL